MTAFLIKIRRSSLECRRRLTKRVQQFQLKLGENEHETIQQRRLFERTVLLALGDVTRDNGDVGPMVKQTSFLCRR